MSDEKRDDEILGRALSRAIETIDVNQTPYERSRIATAPARRSIFGLWQIATAAAAIVLALAIGSWLSRPTDGQPGVAASPTVPASPISTVGPTASPVQATSAPIWVYFARDGLPPVGAYIDGHASSAVLSSPEGRIGSRISALSTLGSGSVPAGATNPASVIATGTSQRTIGTFVSIQGDLAKVEFDLSPGWSVRGSAQALALLQQLVYTITEEPGINRALITEKGKANAVIDQLVIDKPLSREDVSGYAAVRIGDSISQDGPAGSHLKYTTSTDKLAPGLTRFVVTAEGAETPQFSVQAAKRDDTAQSPGKYVLKVQVLGGTDDKQGLETFDSAPLRGVMVVTNPATGTGSAVTTYSLFFDDLRPWRVFTLSNPTRVVVDVGGAPQSVSDRVAVYQPRPGATVTRDLQVTGVGRTFEANVAWRLLDSSGREIAKGNFTGGSNGPLWGAFDTRIAIPTSVSGNVILEVLEFSAKDGSPQGVTQIPLAVR